MGACAAGAMIAGCVGYNIYPAGPDERGFTNVDNDPFPKLIEESMRWVVTRYPPDASTEFTAAAPSGPGKVAFTVNLPMGMSGEIGRRIIKDIGFNAQPLIEGNQKLPIYHISRIWVSGDDAKVDIIRPVLGVNGPSGQSATQAITVRLRGGVESWHVTSHRVWSFNALPVPALYFLPTVRTDPTSPGPPPADISVTPAPKVQTRERDSD